MMRRMVSLLGIALVIFFVAPAALRPAAAATSQAVVKPICPAASWIDVRCYGATGNGSSDDTAAINNALAAALAADEPLFLPHGTFRITRTLTIDYRPRADTGFRLISMGAVINGKSITAQPVLEILCSGGNAHAPAGCFYFDEQGTLFVNADTDRYAVVVGQPDFSDAQNSIKIDHLIVNNANPGSRAGGLQLNYVLNSQIFAIADSAGGAAGIALEQTQISHIGGAGSASAKGGAGLLIENGYSFANTIDAIDLEVAPTCLVIASRNAAHNTFISPYMACATAIDATAGNTTQLVNPLFAGDVKKQFAAAVGVNTSP
ncbi:MAG TPA: glycosyl hydrolase family 28-related protein [Stellaceae bacterium]|nr:glycosyl hydrolase family 28-related protein [Stellaceae bacterium]